MDDYRAMMKADYEAVTKELHDVSDTQSADLTKGCSVNGNLALARRAMMHFGAEANLPPGSMKAFEAKIMEATEIKDAQIARFLHAISMSMGGNMEAGDILTGGGAGFGGTPTWQGLLHRKDEIQRDGGKCAKTDTAGRKELFKEVIRIDERLAGIFD